MNGNQNTYNAVIFDNNFRQAFESKRAKIIMPASGLASDVVLKLQQIPHQFADFPSDFLNNNIVYHANSDEARFIQLKEVLFDEQVEVIWTLRGGYGSARLIDELFKLQPPTREKLFIGFSDNTALHLFFSQHWGWKTVHGAGYAQLLDLNQVPENFLRLADIIAKRVATQQFGPLSPMNAAAEAIGELTAPLQGGNLTLIECSLKTPWEIRTQNTLLFLEEIGEKGYRIDRSLYHLKQAGLFDKVCGIILGEFLGPDPEIITYALNRFANEIQVPVFHTNQFGHGKCNFPLIYQAQAQIIRLKNEVVLQMQVH